MSRANRVSVKPPYSSPRTPLAGPVPEGRGRATRSRRGVFVGRHGSETGRYRTAKAVEDPDVVFQPSGNPAPSAPSIHGLRPREQGGVVARQGFAYHDHVAVAFYLQMLANPQLASVWCEADDDITLI